MSNTSAAYLIDHFSQFPDPCLDRKKPHRLIKILMFEASPHVKTTGSEN
jgi:hypothetical protein